MFGVNISLNRFCILYIMRLQHDWLFIPMYIKIGQCVKINAHQPLYFCIPLQTWKWNAIIIAFAIRYSFFFYYYYNQIMCMGRHYILFFVGSAQEGLLLYTNPTQVENQLNCAALGGKMCFEMWMFILPGSPCHWVCRMAGLSFLGNDQNSFITSMVECNCIFYHLYVKYLLPEFIIYLFSDGVGDHIFTC